MPLLDAERLYSVGLKILLAAGVPEADARIVAAELRDANLAGHDSHGVMRLVQYADYVRDGFVQPDAAAEVVFDAPGVAIVDGHFQFGQVTATKGLELGLAKARQVGCATVLLRNCNHVGRLGSYAQKAALAGFASEMMVNAPGPGGVAPFGGIDRRLGTNPISLSAPWKGGAFVLDMTSSASAEGKVRVAFQKGEPVPEGWIIDSEGRPSTDPAVFYANPEGALLPLGGPLGFKGYGLAVMIDVFAGMLSGSGVARDDLPRGANGVWMYFLDFSQFLARSDYDALVEKYVRHVKGARKMPGTTEILMPGEIEVRREAQRRTEGVPIPDETWRQLGETAARLGTTLD